MRRGWTIVIAACLVLAAAVVAVMRHPRSLPPERCSEVYRQFASHRDIQASYIYGFVVDDSLQLNVTLLQANTDSAWRSLREELNANQPKNSPTYENSVSFYSYDRKDVRMPTQGPFNERYERVLLNSKRQIYYFEVGSQEELRRLMWYFILQLDEYQPPKE